jgi:hypothetical protein
MTAKDKVTAHRCAENRIDTHDISISLEVNIDPKSGFKRATRQLRLLLLSPSAVADGNIEASMERIHRFAHLATEPVAIVFLLHPPRETRFQPARLADTHDPGVQGTLAYAKLQAELMNHIDIPSIPILPVVTLDALPEALKNHAALVTKPSHTLLSPSTSSDLLRLCTLAHPMSQQTANLFSDVFGNLRDVAEGMTNPASDMPSSSPGAIADLALAQLSRSMNQYDENGGLGLASSDGSSEGKLDTLRHLVGDEEFGALVDFWQEEYQI